mmetsp:Transcript_68077/g.221662  ORF Transcript_68077/g.221662 Transcript_68077/m.221662 type:complete len:558 (+) Transcript_68077:152-1825(+)
MEGLQPKSASRLLFADTGGAGVFLVEGSAGGITWMHEDSTGVRMFGQAPEEAADDQKLASRLLSETFIREGPCQGPRLIPPEAHREPVHDPSRSMVMNSRKCGGLGGDDLEESSPTMFVTDRVGEVPHQGWGGRPLDLLTPELGAMPRQGMVRALNAADGRSPASHGYVSSTSGPLTPVSLPHCAGAGHSSTMISPRVRPGGPAAPFQPLLAHTHSLLEQSSGGALVLLPRREGPPQSRTDNVPMLQPRRPTAAAAAGGGSYCGLGEEKAAGPPQEPEDEEWDTRQKQTGAAGRLVVYDSGDIPSRDFLLRGGGTRRIMVTAVTEGGKAALSGVKAGDILVSINGSKEFSGKSADDVHASIRAPVMLVFMGFVGKLQAEVRLNYKQKSCGMASQHEVIYGCRDAPVQVMDEVVFQPTNATLLLATMSSSSTGKLSPGKFSGGLGAASGGEEDSEETDVIDIDSLSTTVDEAMKLQELSAVYELRVHEARKIVTRALLSQTEVSSEARVYGRASRAQTPNFLGRHRPTSKRTEEPAQRRGCDVGSWFGLQCMPTSHSI